MKRQKINIDNYTNDELKKFSSEFMNGVKKLTSTYFIYNQYRNNYLKYHEEISISPAFYHIVNDSLFDSMIITASKLFDSTYEAISIKKLLDHLSKAPNNAIIKFNKKITINIKTNYAKKYFSSDNQNLGLTGIGVRITIGAYFKYLKSYFEDELSDSVKKLKKQRNKIFVHSDPKAIITGVKKVAEEFAIPIKDFERLIQFSSEFCVFLEAIYTDINRATVPSNIDDWENTLNLVRIGQQTLNPTPQDK